MNKDLGAHTTLSHYRIEQKLGAGGMGEVYLAHDTRLRRRVALKLLPAKYTADEQRLQRFEQEACAASALNHPNILTVYEIGAENDTHFIATEHVDGVTLKQKLREAKMRLADVLDVSQQAAFALTAAHAAGVVHRDIKPENIMLRQDHVVKVLDFGLAKLLETESASTIGTEAQTRAHVKTDPGVVMGTPYYMSPEQARGLATDERTDVWSLGVVLYEMIAGRVPFDGETASHVTVSILEHEPAPLARVAPDAPAELQRIVRKCLTKERDERYQTARDLMIDLKNLRRELELQTELTRSAAPHSTDPPHAIKDPAPPNDTVARRASSSASVATEIKRHKKGAILLAALAAVAIAASFRFLPFRSAHALTEKDTILLTDFVNTTGDPVFDGTLKQALAVQVGQSPFLNIFSEDRVRGALRFMGRSPDERVTRDIGREVCERQGLKAMLVGSVASLGKQYAITLEAINAQTGDALALEQATAENKEQVLRALGGAALELRKKLGESLQSIQKFAAPIEQGTTSSLEAFKAFSLGVEQQLNGKYLEAIPFLKRATEIDPNFALAYARMSSMYYNSGLYDLAAEASHKAYELRDRVSERERLYISAGYYDNVTGELEKYLETLELWKRTYPNHAAPPNNLALKYAELGQFDKAAEEAREAIRLNPTSASGYSILAAAFVGLNRFDEAKAIIGQALAQKLDTSAMRRTLYRIAFVQGDATTMQQQIEWAKGKPDEYVAQNWQAENAVFSGRLRKAKEFSNRAFELAERRDLKDVAAQIAGGAAARDALLGDCRQVKERTAKALGISHSQLTMIPAGNALATCGEFSHTQTIAGELVRRFPKDTILNKVSLPLVQARIELHRGNPGQAIQLLETTRPYEAHALFQIAYLRGQAYLNLRRGPDAAAEFQKILDQRGWQTGSPLYPLAHLGLARAAALSGDTTKARKGYQDFFALWKDADPDIPILQEARREYEKLK
ncbi:MAG TPA: protein kinase [Vicinamibacterales bacterium]|nr:protein kinase [Vicinamibacterales bacterium]